MTSTGEIISSPVVQHYLYRLNFRPKLGRLKPFQEDLVWATVLTWVAVVLFIALLLVSL
ncbi:MAG: hypothetical protein P4N59_20920 [Negativicutes bacterium]|nr:hypothetical protein [Negativicutes bacterium]